MGFVIGNKSLWWIDNGTTYIWETFIDSKDTRKVTLTFTPTSALLISNPGLVKPWLKDVTAIMNVQSRQISFENRNLTWVSQCRYRQLSFGSVAWY
mgnify:CR=1 FL=1